MKDLQYSAVQMRAVLNAEKMSNTSYTNNSKLYKGIQHILDETAIERDRKRDDTQKTHHIHNHFANLHLRSKPITSYYKIQTIKTSTEYFIRWTYNI